MPGYSASQSDAASTGAVSNKTGPNFILGGSTGVSMTVILVIIGAGAAIWFFVIRKGK